MTFIRKNFGLLIIYAIIVSMAFLFERPTTEPQTKVSPKQDYVVVASAQN